MFWTIKFSHLHCSLSVMSKNITSQYLTVVFVNLWMTPHHSRNKNFTHHIQENISNLLFDVPVLKSLPQLLKKHLVVCKNCRHLQYKIKNKLTLIYALSVDINVSFQLLLHSQWWMCLAVIHYCLRITNPWCSCCHSVKIKFYSITCIL